MIIPSLCLNVSICPPYLDNVKDDHYIIIRNYITPVVCVISILAIMVTLVVIVLKGLGDSTRYYLTALSIVDLITLLTLFVSCLDYFLIHMIELTTVHRYEGYVSELLNTLLLCSNWITAALGIERYIAVTYPFLAKRIRKIHRTTVVVLIVVGVVIIRIPSFMLFAWDQQSTGISFESFNRSQISTAANYNAAPNIRIFRQVNAWVVDFFIFFVLPFLMLTLTNIRLIIAVKKSSKFMREHGDSNSRQRIDRGELKITTMLVCLIASFLICQGPICVYSACVSVQLIPKFGGVGNLDSMISFNRYFRALSILLLVMKTNINFIFYCWLCDRFCRILKRMVCRGNGPRRGSLIDSTTARHEVYPLNGRGGYNHSTRISNVTTM